MIRLSTREQEITRRVMQAREDVGMTKTDFAEKLGLSKQGYQPYEKFQAPFSAIQLFQVSHILGRSVEWFLGLPTELTADEQQVLALYRQAKELQRGIVALRILEGVIAE